MRFLHAVAIAGLLSLASCGKDEPAPETEKPTGNAASPAEQLFPLDRLARGARVFQEHCAQCHGPEAQGHPDWQRLSRTDTPAAPPLDASGNGWKKTKQGLVTAIKDGVSRNGMSVMPGWKGRLGDGEIGDVIIWFQALWPADVYERWRKANAAPPPADKG